VRLRDVGQVVDTYTEPLSLTRVDGNPAVLLLIHREPGTNIVSVADRVAAKLEGLRLKLPKEIRLIKEEDQSERIRRELATLGERAAFSLVVIFAVLWLFLRSAWSPVIILSTVLFSSLLALNAFAAAHLSVNLLTLAGLALGFGMLVDNSIVVWENIARHFAQGEPAEAAAVRGTREVVLPIVASTFTTVCVFVPFVYLTGELRIYYVPFALAVGFSLLASLVVSFTLIPTVARLALRRYGARSGRTIPAFGTSRLQELYQTALRRLIPRRSWVLVLAAAVVAVSWWVFDRYVTRGPIWSWQERTQLGVSIYLPQGTPLERADEAARKFEKLVVGRPGVERVFTRVWRERARITITFPDSVVYTAFPLILKEELTAEAARTGGVNISVYGFGPGYYRGGGSAGQFYLYVLGYNYRDVCRYADELAARLRLHPRVRNIKISGGRWWSPDHTEIVMQPLRARLAQAGLSVMDLQTQLSAYLRETLGWQQIRLGSREKGSELVSYRIKMAGHERFEVRDLANVLLRGKNGAVVRLGEVARLEERLVPREIVRQNQQYRRTVSFEFLGPWRMGNRFVKSVLATTHLPPGYKLERPSFRWGEEGEKRQIWQLIVLAILLVFMVTAGLFESLTRPFLVLLALPMALVGTFWMFYLTDTNFDRSAYIGVVLLIGIVVNNAILLVYRIGQLRAEGYQPLEAAVLGGGQRLRPILMTSTTTVVGLLPLVLFARPEQSLWYALSLATIGGLTSSTVLVLLVVPLLLSGPIRWPRVRARSRSRGEEV
ncbi:MAG: efflux RND transporter permease subunit, partial [Calditrichaeota bacterium]|nr:efflux RND transporter permease subunit [Calditrichota bacterium]